MDFHEESVDPGAGRRARQIRNHFALPARRRPVSSGKLHAVRRVENDRIAETPHDGERAHIDDEIVIAERRAAIRHRQIRIARFLHFFNHIFHVLGRQELSLLHIDRDARLCRAVDEIRLAAEKRGDLHHIQHASRRCELRDVMHIREHRDAEFFFD